MAEPGCDLGERVAGYGLGDRDYVDFGGVQGEPGGAHLVPAERAFGAGAVIGGPAGLLVAEAAGADSVVPGGNCDEQPYRVAKIRLGPVHERGGVGGVDHLVVRAKARDADGPGDFFGVLVKPDDRDGPVADRQGVAGQPSGAGSSRLADHCALMTPTGRDGHGDRGALVGQRLRGRGLRDHGVRRRLRLLVGHLFDLEPLVP